MQSGIIREFLVKLGFKMDAASERSMREALDKMTDRVKDLAKAGAVMATAVGVAVAKVASDLDSLYFASKRIGASAGNIKAFEYAIKQMGGTSEGARSALESLARLMRNSPGAEGFLQGLGVKTRDSNGNLRDTVEIYKDLAGVLKGMDSAQANAVAQVLGLDDVTLQAIRSGDLLKYMSDYQATMKKLGVDMDKAAESAHRLQQRLNQIYEVIGLLIDKYGAKVADWFDRNAESIQKMATVMAFVVAPIWAMAKAFSFLANVLKAVQATLTALSGGGLLGGLARMLGVGGALATYSGGLNEGEDDAMKRIHAMQDEQTGKGDPKARAMAFFRKLGWSQAQAAGIVANLAHESGLNPRAVGDSGQAFGIAQWHPDRQANFRKWAGKDITASTLEDQLGFVQYELTRGAEQRAGAMLLAARNAQDAGAAMSRYYERPLAADAEAAKRGATAVQLSAQTVIHVNGSADPMSTAQAVANQQTRVAQDQARNFRTVLQ